LISDRSVDELTATTIIKIINERKPQNVKQLVAIVKEEISAPEEKILEVVLTLQSQGKITLDNSSLHEAPKLATYFKTGQALWYWVTLAIAAITVAVVFTVPENFYPWSYLRNALGTVYVLLLPGYAVTKALFPTQVPIKTSTETLDSIERVALSLGMSIAIVPIIGLILNYTPWGISLTPVVISLFALTLISTTVALARERQTKTKIIANSG